MNRRDAEGGHLRRYQRQRWPAHEGEAKTTVQARPTASPSGNPVGQPIPCRPSVATQVRSAEHWN